MIILVTGSLRAQEYADAIERKSHQKIVIASSIAGAITCLHEQDVEALVIDESFQRVESGIDSVVVTHAGSALPIYVNLSLHGAERVAAEVSCGIQRLVRERLLSMRAAARELNRDLRGDLTAILLNSELALRERSLSAGAAEKLRVVCEMAGRMRERLEGRPSEARKMPLRPRLVPKQPNAPVAL